MDLLYIAPYPCMEVISHFNVHAQFSYCYAQAICVCDVSLFEGAMH